MDPLHTDFATECPPPLPAIVLGVDREVDKVSDAEICREIIRSQEDFSS